MWLRYQDSTTQKLFTNPDISFEDLEAKGGLISEKISLWLKSKKNGAQITSHDPEHLHFKGQTLGQTISKANYGVLSLNSPKQRILG